MRGWRSVATLIAVGAGAVAGSAWIPASAQDKPARTLVIGSPSPAVVDLARKLAPAFKAETGISLDVRPLAAKEFEAAKGTVGVVIAPARLLNAAPDAVPVFRSRVVLVGLRGDRARVEGLRDIDKAFQWISSSRSGFVQSSESLGVRAIELSAWERIGVDVLARPRWYDPSRGDETAVAGQAADLGGYTLMEEASWAGLRNRRGLEILVSGDPRLVTRWMSTVLTPSQEAAGWQAWIATDGAREAVSAFRFAGYGVFSTADPPKAVGPATD